MGNLLDEVLAYAQAQGMDIHLDEPDTASFVVESEPLSWSVHVWVREEERQVVVHSVLPGVVPTDRRPAVARLLTDLNFGRTIGNFEIDMSDGETRFKTSIDLGSESFSAELAKPLFLANITAFAQYITSIVAVMDGADPVALFESLDD